MNFTEIFSVIFEGMSPILALFIQLAVCVIAAIVVKFLRVMISKTNIDIADSTKNDIEQLVTYAVKYVNQTFVDDIKKISDNGKLTDLQKDQAYNMAYQCVLALLKTDQYKELSNKLGDNNAIIAETLKILIESTVSDYKQTNTVIPENATSK